MFLTIAERMAITKLKNGTACYLVKYGSVECRKSHRMLLHKTECKRRAVELQDEYRSVTGTNATTVLYVSSRYPEMKLDSWIVVEA